MASEKGHKIWLSIEQHGQLKELAWQRRTTASDLLRTILREAAAGSEQFNGDDTVPSTDKQLSVRLSSTEWDQIKTAIQGSGKSVAEVTRRGISLLAREEL